MADILYWIGIGFGFLFMSWFLIGFWRGLSLRHTDPASRAPERWMGW
jgi:tellurite resistance protein TehA-like permease